MPALGEERGGNGRVHAAAHRDEDPAHALSAAVPRTRSTTFGSVAMKASTSASVVPRPTVTRSDPFAVSRSMPSARMTCDGSVSPDVHADPLETAKPSRSSAVTRDAPSVLRMTNDALFGSRSVRWPVRIASGTRAIERETLMTTAEMKKGLGNLATISTTAPFVGLFGTVAGIIHAFQGMAITGSGGLGAVSAGIAEALVTTAFGLFVAIPAVWLYNYFLNKVDRFTVEMSNSSSQLIDYFIKNEARVRAGRPAAVR